MIRGLGRNISPLDIKDFKLSAYMPRKLGDLSGTMEWNYTGILLDQGNTPHCPGFGAANFGNNPPIVDNFTNADGDRLYYLCKIIDGEPGQENGSNARSVGKMLKQIGRIGGYAFAKNTDEMTYWLLHNGPVMCGTDWYNDMFTPDSNNTIHPTGDLAGGHFYIVNATYGNKIYKIHNSWDDQWGIHGEAFISVSDMAFLLNLQGEAMTAIELPIDAPVSHGCLTNFWKKLDLKRGIITTARKV
jgi:hypothetical protein